MDEKIKLKQLPLIIKIMVVFFILGIVWKVIVFGAYLVIYVNDGNFSKVDHNSIDYQTKTILCKSQTNNSYPNYDNIKKVCYVHICPEGYLPPGNIYTEEDMNTHCEYKSVPLILNGEKQ